MLFRSPITWAIEKRHPLRAVRLALNDLASHGLLIAAVNFVIVGWILLDYTLWQSGIEFYKRWPGDICHQLALMIWPVVVVLAPCSMAVLYDSIRQAGASNSRSIM